LRALRIIEGIADSPGKSTPVVLIVEDDSLLRVLAVEVVEQAGLVALEAADADEAVALWESRLDISLLFTDVNMPGKRGRVETGPRRARPLATHKNSVGIGTRPAAGL
jgi:CheY-like chemotaxis protein